MDMRVGQVVAAFNILLSDKQVKAILVNIFGEALTTSPALGSGSHVTHVL